MTVAHPAVTSNAGNRQAMVAQRLARALDHGHLQLVYQPVIDLRSREVTSIEALCRWNDDELGQVPPDEFIAAAETQGLIVALGEYLLQQVLTDLPQILKRWPTVRVAINVSGLELEQPDFAERMSACIQAEDPRLAHHLELEVTESAFHHKVEVVRYHLLALRELGLTVAIDDFGTGQSSLARLHMLPFDKIKLDRSFVQALNDPMAQAIVKAMAQLANTFSRSLVVEGIETTEQLQHLMQLGCRMGQGYLLCRPATLQALLEQPMG